MRSAGAIRHLPFRGGGESLPVRAEDVYEPAPEDQRYARMFTVSDGLFDPLGLRMLRGRDIEATDGEDGPLVAVVNEAFVCRFFLGEDPVGRRFAAGNGEVEVVGVVTDVHHRGITEPPRPTVHVSNDQAISDIVPLTELTDENLARPRFFAGIRSAFALGASTTRVGRDDASFSARPAPGAGPGRPGLR